MRDQGLIGSSKLGTGAKVALFQGEGALIIAGLFGLLLAVICGVWVVLNGGPIAPNGDVSKAISFNAALGVFLLSTAAVFPLAKLKRKGKALFRWSFIGLAAYSYGAETIQNFRGANPRFVDGGSAFDTIVGSVFGLVAVLLLLMYLGLAIQYFRRNAYQVRPELVVGVRYAMIAVMVSFAAGIWISIHQSRFTGLHGNMIWLHGLGFHALQVLPIVAWLSERTALPTAVRNRWISLTGIAYFLGLAAIGWQTLQGKAILEWSILPVAASCCFLITIAIGAYMLRQTLAKPANAKQYAGVGMRG